MYAQVVQCCVCRAQLSQGMAVVLRGRGQEVFLLGGGGPHQNPRVTGRALTWQDISRTRAKLHEHACDPDLCCNPQGRKTQDDVAPIGNSFFPCAPHTDMNDQTDDHMACSPSMVQVRDP